MNEPKRWIEEGPPLAVEKLLRAADAEQPSDGSLRRVLSGLGVGLGATGAAASAGAAATVGAGAALATGKGALAVGVWAKWVVLSVAAVGAGAAAVHRASTPAEQRHATVSAVAPSHPAHPAPVAVVDPVAPAIVATAPALGAEEARAVARVKPVAPSSRTASAPAAEVPIDAERLAEEVRAVDRARSALANGRAAESLAALDEYETRFGGRKFAPEALYLRMQALLSLGRRAEARSAAERLVRVFPKSPHTARARRVLSETNP
jgi:hypothetical protein